MSDPHFEDPDLPIADMMRRWPETMPVFIAHGILFVGCMVGAFHAIDDVCAEYCNDPKSLLDALQAVIMPAAAPEVPGGAAERR